LTERRRKRIYNTKLAKSLKQNVWVQLNDSSTVITPHRPAVFKYYKSMKSCKSGNSLWCRPPSVSDFVIFAYCVYHPQNTHTKLSHRTKSVIFCLCFSSFFPVIIISSLFYSLSPFRLSPWFPPRMLPQVLCPHRDTSHSAKRERQTQDITSLSLSLYTVNLNPHKYY
jgi:hypothetical protein